MKDITSITKTTEAPSSSTNIYIEDGGNFRRSSLEHMKETLGINDANDAIEGESERAKEAEKGLSEMVSTNASDITNEISRAKNKESELSDKISTNASAISDEVTRAKEAEQANATAISDEATRATEAEALKANKTDLMSLLFTTVSVIDD